MINNKQINLWRGDEDPSTTQHLWIKKDLTIEIHNGEKWVTFVDNAYISQELIKMQEVIDSINTNTLKTGYTGTYLNKEDSVSKSFEMIDTLLETQILE